MPSGYSVGSAFLQVVPSFEGMAQTLEAEFAKFGRSTGAKFGDTFNQAVISKTSSVNLGPSDSNTAKQGVSAGGKFADSFKARVEAALKNLPDIAIGADVSEADAKLAELRVRLDGLSNTKIGVDISEAEAMAELDKIKAELDEVGARSPNIRVKVDTAAASAELAKLQAQIATVDAMGDIPINANDGGSLESASSGVSGIGIAIIALLPLLGPLAGGLAAVGAGIAATIGAVGAGIGVAALGISDISDASKLLTERQKALQGAARSTSSAMGSQASSAGQLKQAQASLGQAQANAADQAISAAERVKTAEQGVDDAITAAAQNQKNAAAAIVAAQQNLASVRTSVAARAVQDSQSVVDAERNLAQAAQTSAQAQQSLNSAREQAARDLQSYAASAVDANLNVQQSQIDLVNAQTQYQTDQANPKITPIQLQQDALNIAKAQQSIVEAQTRAAQAQEDNNTAQKNGVANAPGVISAQKQIANSVYAQQQAVLAVTDAQSKQKTDAVDGAAQIVTAQKQIATAAQAAADQRVKSTQQVAQSQQQLADATRAQQTQARNGAFAIAQAQAGIASAMRSAASGAAKGGNSAAADQLALIDAQLAKINPKVVAFAQFVQGKLKPAFQGMKDAAGVGLLPGLQSGLDTILPHLPALNGFITTLSGVVGDLFAQFTRSAGAPAFQKFFEYVSTNTGPILQTLFRIIFNLGRAFATFMTDMGPTVAKMGSSIADWAGKLADSDSIPKFAAWIEKNGPTIAGFFGGLIDLAVTIVEDFTPLGVIIMKAVGWFSEFLSSLNPDLLLAFVAAVGVLIAVVMAPVAGIIGVILAVTAFGVAVMAVAAIVVRHWSDITHAFSVALDWVKNVFFVGWHAVEGYLIQPLGNAAGAVGRFFTDTIPHLFMSGVNWVKNVFVGAWHLIDGYIFQPLEDAGKSVGNFFTKTIPGWFNGAKDWVKNTFVTAWHDEVYKLTNVFTEIKTFLSTVWHDIETVFVKGVNFVTQDILNPMIRLLNKGLSIFNVKIPEIPAIVLHFANGGVLPGFAPGVDSIPAMLSPGEGVLVPEAVRGIGGASGVHALNSMFAPRIGHFANGGVAGDTGSGGTSIWDRIGSAISGAISGATSMIRSGAANAALGLIKTLEAPLLAAMNLAPSGFAKTLAQGMFDNINTRVHDFISGHSAPVAAGGATSSGSNVQLGQSMAAAHGWTGDQWTALLQLWTRESGWRTNADNPTSSAYGIPQSLPGSKMASAGADWMTNPATQIAWGLNYIAGRYGNPANAWSHEVSANWYDGGGMLPPGVTMAMNGTGQPEAVFTQAQLKALGTQSRGGSFDDSRMLAALSQGNANTGQMVTEYKRTPQRQAFADRMVGRGGH